MAKRTAKEQENGYYKLTFFCPAPGEWQNVNKKVMMIPQRRFVPNTPPKKGGFWEVPVCPRSQQMLNQLKFQLVPLKIVEPERAKRVPVYPTAWKDEVIADMDERARKYQVEGVQRMQAFGYNCLLADDQGTGKSLMSLSVVRTTKKLPVLFICPSTLKINLAKEAKMWLNPTDNMTVHIASGRSATGMNYKDSDIVIINYDILWDHMAYIMKEFKPKLVLIDEAHELKGGEKAVSLYYDGYRMKKGEIVRTIRDIEMVCKVAPKRVRAAQFIVNGIPANIAKRLGTTWAGVEHVIPMSGTFLNNDPSDMFNVLQMIDPKTFNSREVFVDFFCKMSPGYKNNIPKISGGKNMDILHALLVEKYMIRRMKSEVLPELPASTKVVIPLELSKTDRKTYDDYETNSRDIATRLKEYSVDKDKGQALADMLMLAEEYDILPALEYMARKQSYNPGTTIEEFANDDKLFKWVETLIKKECESSFRKLMDMARDFKMKGCVQFIEQQTKADPKKKLIIFAHNKVIVDQLMEKFGKKAVKLVGSMNPKQKDEAVMAFQNDPKINYIILNLKAGSVGITLTASDTVIFVQTGWLAHIISQAIDRANRIGQTSDKVLAYFLQANDTIEKYVIKKLDSKASMIAAGMNGEEVEEEDMLSFLWDIFSTPKEEIEQFIEDGKIE